MSIRSNVLLPLLVSFSLSTVLTAQVTRNHDVALKNWPAPLYWQPSQAESEVARAGLDPTLRPPSPEAATPAGSLVFVAMTPCRVVDTRTSSMFPAPFGAPSLVANATRSFPIESSTQCTIPATAQAYSFNVTLVPPGPVGYLTIWPTAPPPNTPPNAVTLDDFPTGDIRNNAAIVPAGITNGSVSIITNAATDLVIDINGYFAPSTGITLAQGTAAAPSLSFAGDAGTGIFSSGTGSLSLATGGTAALTVDPTGDVELPGSVRKGGTLFLHNLGVNNTAVGLYALEADTTGSDNTASGSSALLYNTTGSDNTASGDGALQVNTTGSDNTASGSGALHGNTTGTSNTATGAYALGIYSNTGSANTATGAYALGSNSSGSNNTAVGVNALYSFSGSRTGSNNIALGFQAGFGAANDGSNNIDIGNGGSASDGITANSGVIRIGESPFQTSFFAAGISGVMTGGAGTAVLIDSNGQLGTISSSRRYKEDIQDMAEASSALLRLRPVTFRYQKPYADGSKPLDYGLIAEEVAEVYPDLVVKSADGEIETVQYQKLTPMLLNELLKERQERSQEQQYQRETIQSLQAQVAGLQKEQESLHLLQTEVLALQRALETRMAGHIQ